MCLPYTSKMYTHANIQAHMHTHTLTHTPTLYSSSIFRLTKSPPIAPSQSVYHYVAIQAENAIWSMSLTCHVILMHVSRDKCFFKLLVAYTIYTGTTSPAVGMVGQSVSSGLTIGPRIMYRLSCFNATYLSDWRERAVFGHSQYSVVNWII